jgi:hypothetical protein
MRTLRNSRVARPHVATPAPGSWIVETGGGGGGSTFAKRTVSGVQDGTNIIFTVPVALTSFQLFRNGVLQSPGLPGKPGDYTFTTGSGVTTIAISVWPVAIKGEVATQAALPASGNQLNDGWVTSDTGHLWIWNGSAWVDSTGLIRGPAPDDLLVVWG